MSNIGDTIVFELKCYDQDGALFDPDVVEASIIGLSNAEELVTYNGTETRDNWISKISVGVYRLIVTITKSGCLSVLPRWKHHTTLGDGTLVVTPPRAITEMTLDTSRQFGDRT